MDGGGGQGPHLHEQDWKDDKKAKKKECGQLFLLLPLVLSFGMEQDESPRITPRRPIGAERGSYSVDDSRESIARPLTATKMTPQQIHADGSANLGRADNSLSRAILCLQYAFKNTALYGVGGFLAGYVLIRGVERSKLVTRWRGWRWHVPGAVGIVASIFGSRMGMLEALEELQQQGHARILEEKKSFAADRNAAAPAEDPPDAPPPPLDAPRPRLAAAAAAATGATTKDRVAAAFALRAERENSEIVREPAVWMSSPPSTAAGSSALPRP